MRRLAVLIALLAAGMAAAEEPGEAARAAAERLANAAQMLDEAKTAQNRVRALTETIRAYEDGLQAMREGLRRAAIREQALTQELHAREAEISRLLGALQSMGHSPAPVLLLHPSGPVGTARSGMILADVTPALTTQAGALRDDLQEVSVLRALQKSAANKLQEGLRGVQDARTALSQAMADRTDLPRRFTEDPVKTALLVASAETLEGFASGLSGIAVGEVPGSLPDITDRKGDLALPVTGRILRRAGEADAAGIARPGIVMATRPRALVTTPAAATVRYRGPLLDYGNVVILEPDADYLLILAGAGDLFVAAGELVAEGAPLGLMPGGVDDVNADLIVSEAQGGGAGLTETLYIELRQGGSPVNPLAWFAAD